MANSSPLGNTRKARPGLRRLSSTTATQGEVSEGGPVVVVPEKNMHHHRARTHDGFAASIAIARSELAARNFEEALDLASPTASTPATPGTPITPADIPSEDTFAFAFDIDGVLIRGGRPIPEAVETMKVLNGENDYGIKM